jgi:proline dehydrogenase
MTRGLLLRMANSPAVERFVKRNGMSAGFARRFIAGETMEETVAPVRALNERGITASLDYLGENVSRPEEAEQSVAYYLRLLGFIDEHGLNANISLKLTQLGLDLSEEIACANMSRILEEAQRFSQFVRIDMEGSDYTQRTLDLFYCLWSRYQCVGVVIQSYLYRSEADVEKLIETGARVRLVKGAYQEPKEIAYPLKKDVDANFHKLMETLLSRGAYPAIATHDETLIRATKEFARDQGIGPDKYEFQMLYGIRRDLQHALVQDGYRMRVYIPFGTQWYPYMMRRLAERPANLWFVLRNSLRR